MVGLQHFIVSPSLFGFENLLGLGRGRTLGVLGLKAMLANLFFVQAQTHDIFAEVTLTIHHRMWKKNLQKVVFYICLYIVHENCLSFSI